MRVKSGFPLPSSTTISAVCSLLLTVISKKDSAPQNTFTWSRIKASINECINNYKDKIEYNTVDDRQIINLTEKDNVYEDVNEEFEKKMNNLQSRKSAIEDLVKCLEERERKIIMLFFGLGKTEKEMNLEEISREMSLTKERVRQIKDTALVKLKCEALCSPEFETYREIR